MPLEPGQTLLHYRLIEQIGEGGMGVVWRGEDTTLQREVAIKILPEAVAGDAERLARFSREARTLAALNHPNIAAVYGLHDTDGVNFLVMELVRGEDLSQRVARGPLPVDESLRIARAVADALRAAHTSGVVHRDLKPANIRLGADGEVKVLDFGLAKALSPAEAHAASEGGLSPMNSPTITSLGTVAGVLLGTAAYMSPEQARGRAVDRRADVWAFGCVLFEMLTGELAFPGETITDTLAAVVRGEPEWDRLPSTVPTGVTRVLRLCLAKDPAERLHDIADAVLLVDALAGEATVTAAPPVAAPPPSRGRERVAWGIAALAVVVAIALALVGGAAPDDAAVGGPPTRFVVPLPDDAPLSFDDLPILAMSRDGRKIAFVAANPDSGRPMIHVRALERSDPWVVPGTEGASNPFFSPDGEQLGFFADGDLKRVELAGGSAVTLADAPTPRGGTWLDDDTIVYSPEYASGLWRVPAAGGTPRLVIGPDDESGERTFRWPLVLPGDRAVLFTVGSVISPNNYDRATIEAVTLADGERHPVVADASMARFVPPRTLVFSRQGALFAVAFDTDDLEMRGDPVRVMEGVGGDPSSGAGYYDVSRGGDLVHVEGAITDRKARLVLVDRDGTATPLPIDPRGFRHPRFSPDGSRIAFTVNPEGLGLNADVWVYSFADSGLRRVTFGGGDQIPVWRRDGRELSFVSTTEAMIATKAADGSGDVVAEMQMNGVVSYAASWSPDGETLALIKTATTTDIYLLTRGESEPRLFESDASAPAISPDGHWVAYASPASGNTTIYVRPLTGEGKWQVSPNFGGYPRWSPDGRRLFFIEIDKARRPLLEVTVADDVVFRGSMPRVVLSDTSRYTTATAPLLNWDTDGERFAFVELFREGDAMSRVDVTLDWASHLGLGAAR